LLFNTFEWDEENIEPGIMSSLTRLKKSALISHMLGRVPIKDILYVE
jgi:hypothetical protein